MSQITVTARGDFGNHPKHGLILQGQKYTIDERDFAPQLFEPPTADYKPIWEREAEEEAAKTAAVSVDDGKKTAKGKKEETPAAEGGTV